MKNDALDLLLNSLKKHGIEKGAVVSKEGDLISANFQIENSEFFATTSSLIYGSAEKTSLEFKKGIPENIIIETKNTTVILRGAGKVLLIAFAQKNLMNKETLHEINATSQKLENLLYIKDIYLTFQ